MDKNVSSNVTKAQADLEQSNRVLKRKLTLEKRQKNQELDHRKSIQINNLKMKNAIRDQKEQEMCSVISFYALTANSTAWNTVIPIIKNHYLELVKVNNYPIICKDHISHLQPSVDVCVTIRNGTAAKHIKEVLHQILDEIEQSDNFIYQSEKRDYLDKSAIVSGGILYT